eukprot:Rhum_TRINITY_DN14846_c2_g1::Rhum_TRINITY_DN14846_c2_g1_i1::g.122817::m.122817
MSVFILSCIAAVSLAADPECTSTSGVTPGFICSKPWATGLQVPRGMAVLKSGGKTHVLVVQAIKKDVDTTSVLLMVDDDGDGSISDAEKTVLATEKELTHGIVITNGFLYASSATDLFRWAYTPGSRTPLGAAKKVMTGLSDYPKDEGGSGETKWGHKTRTLVADATHMYISVGSWKNLDTSPFRSAIRRVELSRVTVPDATQATLQFTQQEVLANGLRNEVGLTFDADGTLWGVENGADNLAKDSLGGDIHNDNPAEELNRFDKKAPGRFYGYPYCFSEFLLPKAQRDIHGSVPGRNWLWDGYGTDVRTDAWCDDEANVVKPVYSFQAHMAPLGVEFLKDACELSPQAFPCAWKNRVFVAFHGSWNRDPDVGFKVCMADPTQPATPPVDLLEYIPKFPTPERPVDVKFDPITGVLYVSSDASGEIIVLSYNSAAPTTDAPTTLAPNTTAPDTPDTAAPQSTPSPTAAPAAGAGDVDDGGLSVAATVAIVLGSVAVVALLAAIGWVAYRQFATPKNQNQVASSTGTHPPYAQTAQAMEMNAMAALPPGTHAPVEL